jgi:uncharacterized protein YcbK (DUF882 family)
MQRRTFLLGGLAALASGPRILQAKIHTNLRHLSLFHTHTEESLDVAYSKERDLSREALTRLNHFLRDFRTEEITRIDPRLFKTLYELKRRAGNPDGVIEIISAYRSPETNAKLRRKSKGVARKSLHVLGKAVDIRLRGTATSELRDIAIAMGRGGVGYYRRSDFIHLDTGQVRHW